jgi:hypothetical protein
MPLPPWHPKVDPIGQAYFARLAEMDIGFRQKFRELNRRLPLFVLLCIGGCSGFRMSTVLRHYFIEYLNRLTTHGPHTLPSSFNVVEAFLSFNNELKVFDIRQEREHLLRLHDYFNWYTAEHKIPNDPKILVDIMEEGLIYSFDLAGDTGEFAISTEGSNLAIAGVSLIRHENELSVILLAGENPPNPPDSEIANPKEFKNKTPFPGHENIAPNPDLSIQDRYLDGMAGFSKILILTRFNLEAKKHDVRYVYQDIGYSYFVFTDDRESCAELTKEDQNYFLENSLRGLKRYGQLFSALTSLIYLPIIFISEPDRVVDSKFVTELYINRQKHRIKKATQEFGKDTYHLHRIVKCLSSTDTNDLVQSSQRIIDPPNFSFESVGFWKPLEPNKIGMDKNGNSIVGKTWVERVDSYSANSPESFIIQNIRGELKGDDPGVVYIVRSAAHGNDIYKVGLTRRSAKKRAQELGTSTGVPLAFGVLASWQVANCSLVEKEVHLRLKQYRVNKNREFFCVSLSTIVAAIEQTISYTKRSFPEKFITEPFAGR